MKSFFIKLWNVIRPQIGKIISFIVGAVVSAAGLTLSEQSIQDISNLLSGLIG